MREEEARKKIKDLKAFYGHLVMFTVIMVCLAIVNLMTYLRGDPEIWVIYPLVFWGAMVLLQGIAVHHSFGAGKRWEEEKFRELTGWNSTNEELVRLSQRVDTLLTILSSDGDRSLSPELEALRQQLLEVRSTIERFQSPLDASESDDDAPLRKQDVVSMIERLEAVLTSRAFQQFDDATTQTERGQRT